MVVSSLVSNTFWEKYNLLYQDFDNGLDIKSLDFKFNDDVLDTKLDLILKEVLSSKNLNAYDSGFLKEYLEEGNDFSSFKVGDFVITKDNMYFAFSDSSDSLYFFYDNPSKTYIVANDLVDARYSFEKPASQKISKSFEYLYKNFMTPSGKYTIVFDDSSQKLFSYGFGVNALREYLVPIVLNNKSIGKSYYSSIAPFIEADTMNTIPLNGGYNIFRKYLKITERVLSVIELVNNFIKPNIDLSKIERMYVCLYTCMVYIKSIDGKYACFNFVYKDLLIVSKEGVLLEEITIENIDIILVNSLYKDLFDLCTSVKSPIVEYTYPVLEFNIGKEVVSACPSNGV